MTANIERALMPQFMDKVRPGKVMILFGARRVGKTELIASYLKAYDGGQYLLLNGDDQTTAAKLAERSVTNYKRLIGDAKLLVIDEAQKVPDIGMMLKLMVDSFKDVAFIATGSSVFDLGNRLGEPLVGRSNTLRLYPLAQMEFRKHENFISTTSRLEERMIYGSYPELQKYAGNADKETYLRELVNSYLFKDILEYEGIRKADKITSILRMLALQVGSQVSIEELARNAKGISRNTVETYLDLLSKVFVIYRRDGFSKNLRKEISKTSRWYFYDNGIRNALINNFNPMALRQDTGQLWENFMMSERMKYMDYSKQSVNSYFWRTYDQQEIDLIEEKNNKLNALEFKWNKRKKDKVPVAWQNAYPEAGFHIIDQQNYIDFLGG